MPSQFLLDFERAVFLLDFERAVFLLDFERAGVEMNAMNEKMYIYTYVYMYVERKFSLRAIML